jgi:transcriptional regulator with XRE-family HTH domain
MTEKKSPLLKSESGITMEDLAELAGVSAITVSRALRNSPLVTEKTRAKVRAIAEQQGYRLNISARNLRLRRSYSIAVVVEMTPAANRPMSDPYPLDLLGGITQADVEAIDRYGSRASSRRHDPARTRSAWRSGATGATHRLAAGGVGRAGSGTSLHSGR